MTSGISVRVRADEEIRDGTMKQKYITVDPETMAEDFLCVDVILTSDLDHRHREVTMAYRKVGAALLELVKTMNSTEVEQARIDGDKKYKELMEKTNE